VACGVKPFNLFKDLVGDEDSCMEDESLRIDSANEGKFSTNSGFNYDAPLVFAPRK